MYFDTTDGYLRFIPTDGQMTVLFLSACIEEILQLLTNFYLQRKFSIFLRNDRDCKVVDPYNARKRYAVTENSDLMRNIPWLSSCFSKIKKPISIV